MNDNRRSAALWVLAAVGAIFVINQLGVIDVGISWPTTGMNESETVLEQEAPATVIDIEPIALDCRARVHTTVPIVGRREHTMFDRVYRTDTISMEAVGDIDTCVETDGVEILTDDDGTAQVTVDAAAIRFVRPRVDAGATRDSIEVSKGFIGRLTDVFPWVSANDGLTAAAYSYAQDVIGSSECAETAFDETREVIIESYREQFRSRGGDPDELTVRVVGEPDFGDDRPGSDLVDYEFVVGSARCEVATGTERPPTPADPGENDPLPAEPAPQDPPDDRQEPITA